MHSGSNESIQELELSSSDDIKAESGEQIEVKGCWGRFRKRLHEHYLSSGVSMTHLISYLVCVMMTVCFFVFLNVIQPSVLSNILKIPANEIGNAAGTVTFYDEIVTVCTAWAWGILSDFVGRKLIYGVGFILMGTGMIVYPYANGLQSPFFGSLLSYRMLFALGASACASMMTAVLSDYSHQSSRGKVSALVGVFSGIGAIFGALVLPRLPLWIVKSDTANMSSLDITFGIVGGLSLISAVIALAFLQSTPSIGRQKKNIKKILKEGLFAMKDPIILISYFGGFLVKTLVGSLSKARADSISLSLFLPLWATRHFITTGDCTVAQDQCKPAIVLASTLTGVSQVLALLAAPLYGIFADRVSRLMAVLLASFIGAISFSSFYFFGSDPSPSPIYAPVIFSGISQIGMIVTSMSLLSTNCAEEIRGSVAGYYSFAGGIGILFIAKVGGLMFDSVAEASPFLLLGIMKFGLLVFGIIYVVIQRMNKH